MKEIAVIGAGYVGLVTGVCLADVGHAVTCIDIDQGKINVLKQGKSPIYEPGLEELIQKNMAKGHLLFSHDFKEGIGDAEVIYLAVGTPQRDDGSANLDYIEQAVKDIAACIKLNTIIVTKSTVPVGTNHRIKEMLSKYVDTSVTCEVVSNPEFLREGSAIADTFNGDRIVIGAEHSEAFNVIEEINKPFNIPIMKTDIRSAEMIKYASNAFLATKISFINEISTVCEKLNANVEDVAVGMGLDKRIGSQFLHAGIGYGGSCFPKDTKALLQIAGNVEHPFHLLSSVIEVNNRQRIRLVRKVKKRFNKLEDLKIAVLGLAFKPNTDDMREAASTFIIGELLQEGARIVCYDPVAMNNAKNYLSAKVDYASSIEEVLEGADAALLITEWQEFKELPLDTYEKYMKQPIVFDGRNCYDLKSVANSKIEYHSIGRPSVNNTETNSLFRN